VNLPGVPVDLPAVSPKDAQDLEFGVKNDVEKLFRLFSKLLINFSLIWFLQVLFVMLMVYVKYVKYLVKKEKILK